MAKVQVVYCKDSIFSGKPDCPMSYSTHCDDCGYPAYTTVFLLNNGTDYCPYGVDKRTGEKAERGRAT